MENPWAEVDKMLIRRDWCFRCLRETLHKVAWRDWNGHCLDCLYEEEVGTLLVQAPWPGPVPAALRLGAEV